MVAAGFSLRWHPGAITMRRFEAIQQIMDVVTDEIVVCNLGHPSQELFAVKDRPRNFYMLGSMGMASSIGLGLALSTSRTVIVLDGDGAILMNLGSLATIGISKPKNYVLIIIDNEAYGSTGFQRTFTARGLHIEHVAQACGIERAVLITDKETIAPTLRAALAAGDGPYCLVIKTRHGVAGSIGIIPYDAVTIRDRLMSSMGDIKD